MLTGAGNRAGSSRRLRLRIRQLAPSQASRVHPPSQRLPPCQKVIDEYSDIGRIIQILPPHVEPSADLEERTVAAMVDCPGRSSGAGPIAAQDTQGPDPLRRFTRFPRVLRRQKEPAPTRVVPIPPKPPRARARGAADRYRGEDHSVSPLAWSRPPARRCGRSCSGHHHCCDRHPASPRWAAPRPAAPFLPLTRLRARRLRAWRLPGPTPQVAGISL